MNRALLLALSLLTMLSLLFGSVEAVSVSRLTAAGSPPVNFASEPLPDLILPDEEFTRASDGWDIDVYLRDYPGIFKDYSFQNFEFTVSGPQAVVFYSELSGVNPKVLLALMELKGNLLSGASRSADSLAVVFGKTGPEYVGFQNQINWGVMELTAGYADRLNGKNELQIVLKDGTVYDCPQSANAATCSLLRFMGLIAEPEEWRQWVMEQRFTQIYTDLFGEPPADVYQVQGLQEYTVMAPGDMRLPFGNGETWYYTGGPHNASAGGVNHRKAAVDFAPGGGSGCGWTSNSAVRAVKAGRVTYASCDLVKIDHGGNWVTSYFHLRGIAVHVGQDVQAGTVIGYPSCNTGRSCGWAGSSTGVHVHFDVRYGNTPQRIHGTSLGGWTIQEAAADYSGTMTQGGVTKTASTRKSASNELRAYETNVDTDDGRSLSSGGTVYGTRNPGNDEDIYYIQASSGQQLTVEMWNHNSSLDSFVYVRDPNNQVIGSNDDSNGTRNSRLSLRLSSSGRYTVVAKGYSSSTGGYGLKATLSTPSSSSSQNWLQHNQTVSASLGSNSEEDTYYFNGVQGRITSLRMWAHNSSVDTYLELYAPNGSRIATNDDDHIGGTRNSWIAVTLPSSGVYRVKARSYAHASSGNYQIRLRWVESANLAEGRNGYATSVESGSYSANKAFDGNTSTRWSSQFRDNESIYVDLGSAQTVNMVSLRWEAAYASRYGIYYWNGSRWVNVFWTDRGRGGTEIINFTTVNTRYVLLLGASRGTPWGVSLWEMGVYNRASATPPLITEDPDKTPDAIEPAAPPSPTGPGKDDEEMALILSENGYQEFAPEPGTYDGSGEGLTLSQVGKPSAAIEAIHWDDSQVLTGTSGVTFTGSAVGSDAENPTADIVAYEWKSNLDGVIGNQAEFTTKASTLTPGEHTITFRVKNQNGVWSDPARVTISFDVKAVNQKKLFIPAVTRQ